MNRIVPPRPGAVPARPVRTAPLQSGPRFQPKKKGILGRIVRWFLFLGITGAIVASFFIQAGDGKTYADLYTKPAYRWSKDKFFQAKDMMFPPETETASVKKEAVPAGPSEFDTKFEEAVADRERARAETPPEAVDEAVPFLEKALEAAGRRIDAVREVGLEASKTAMRKTRVGAAQAVEELAAQARVQKELAAALVKRKSSQDVKAALAAVPPPPPPAPPPPPPPSVVPYDLKKFHAWPAQPAGTWVRWKKTAGETVSTEDHVLATLTDEAAVVRIEAIPGNQATADRVFVFAADAARVVREESLKVGDAEIPCRVVQSGATLRWIPKEGPGADRVALKVQAGDRTIVVTELVEEEIPVKGEPKKCLKVTVGDTTSWGHDEVPGFVVRVKTGTETAEAVEWSTDPAARPAPPKPAAAAPKKTASAPVAETPAPVQERSVKSLLAEAEQLTNEGAAILRDVIELMKDASLAPETLKSLLSKTESASSMFVKAREGYVSARAKAQDPAPIDEKVARLGRALEVAAKHAETLKARLQ